MRITHLIPMQPSHTSLHLGSADVFDALSFLVLHKDAREQPDQIGAVQENVRLFQGHAVVDTPGEMFHPDSILSTHVFLFAAFFLLASEEQTLC